MLLWHHCSSNRRHSPAKTTVELQASSGVKFKTVLYHLHPPISRMRPIILQLHFVWPFSHNPHLLSLLTIHNTYRSNVRTNTEAYSLQVFGNSNLLSHNTLICFFFYVFISVLFWRSLPFFTQWSLAVQKCGLPLQKQLWITQSTSDTSEYTSCVFICLIGILDWALVLRCKALCIMTVSVCIYGCLGQCG